jgi:hypothetical protein
MHFESRSSESAGTAAAAERPCIEVPASWARRDRGCAHVDRFICESDIRRFPSREIAFAGESGADRRAHMRYRGCFVPAGENDSQSNETQFDFVAGHFRDLQVHAESNVPGFRAGSAWVGRISVQPGSACSAPRVGPVYQSLSNHAGRTCACFFIPTCLSGIPGQGAAMDLVHDRAVQTVRFRRWASQDERDLWNI